MTKKTCISLTVKVVKIVSKYTTELRYICEVESGLTESKGYNDVNSIIQQAIPKIFSFNFPIFDESYRNVLETKILKHYYTQEIGLETYGLWKLKLDTKLNEIMPYYNQLYESATLEFNPLYDVDYTDTRTGGNTQKTQSTRESSGNKITENKTIAKGENENKVTNTGNKNTDNNNTTQTRFSDTPQGGLNDMFIEANGYLTNVTIVNSNDNTKETVNNTENGNVSYSDDTTVNGSENRTENVTDNETLQTTEEYINKIQGKRGGQSYASMISEYRNIIVNIDMMIINDLNDLFMNIW